MKVSQFIEHYNIKTALVIENETIDKGSGLAMFINKLVNRGVNVTVVERAFMNDKKEALIKGLTECDSVFFESQFRYWEQVHSVALLFSKFPTKNIFGHNVLEYQPLITGLESVLEPRELASMAHHNLYWVKEWTDWDKADFELDEGAAIGEIEKIDLNVYVRKTKALDLLKKRVNVNRDRDQQNEKVRNCELAIVTNNKVKILDIQACGDEWSLLKKGDIVNELDCLTFDPCPETGIWVMGKNEPVKLLNDYRCTEWEYVEVDPFLMGIELLSMIGKKNDTTWINLMPTWINEVAFREEESEDKPSAYEMINNLLDTHNVPRRGNRGRIVAKIEGWAKNHKYFVDKPKVFNQITRYSMRLAQSKQFQKEEQARKKALEEELKRLRVLQCKEDAD